MNDIHVYIIMPDLCPRTRTCRYYLPRVVLTISRNLLYAKMLSATRFSNYFKKSVICQDVVCHASF